MSGMTRRHFAAVADSLKESRPESGGEAMAAWEWVVDCMVSKMRGLNANFNETRFREACGDER